jgi:hypothetical protein
MQCVVGSICDLFILASGSFRYVLLYGSIYTSNAWDCLASVIRSQPFRVPTHESVRDNVHPLSCLKCGWIEFVFLPATISERISCNASPI